MDGRAFLAAQGVSHHNVPGLRVVNFVDDMTNSVHDWTRVFSEIHSIV